LNKKVIIFSSLLVVFFIFVTPSIPAVQNQVLNNSIHEKILECIKNKDFRALKEFLVQLIDNIEEPSVRFLHLRSLFKELDMDFDDNDESKIKFTFLNLLSFVIGIILIIIGVFTMYFGSGKSRIYGTLIALAGIILIILS
jgi:hypothetical protein